MEVDEEQKEQQKKKLMEERRKTSRRLVEDLIRKERQEEAGGTRNEKFFCRVVKVPMTGTLERERDRESKVTYNASHSTTISYNSFGRIFDIFMTQKFFLNPC